MRLCFVATETYPDDDKIGRHLILSLDVWILYCSPTSNIETSNTTITRTHTHHILYITQESILSLDDTWCSRTVRGGSKAGSRKIEDTAFIKQRS